MGDVLRTLRRSRSDRVVAGVLGGLGARLHIDPVILRVTTAVLALFGGVGVLLYAVAWLLIPAEDESGSVLDQALGRHERSPGSIPLAIFLVVVVLGWSGSVFAGSWDGIGLMILAVIGLLALLRRDSEPMQTPTGTPTPATEADIQPAPAMPAPGSVSTGWPEGPDWQPYSSEPVSSPPLASPRKPRSVLGPVTVSAAVLSVGVLAINDATWADVTEAMYIAVPLGIVAIGLLIGTWFGRSRGLIALGILLSLALIPTTVLSGLNLSAVNATVQVDAVADLPAETVSYGAGSVTYDLSNLVLTDSDNVRLAIEQGAGELTVIVPPNVDVIVNGSTGAGEIKAFDHSFSGLGRDERITDAGADGPGGGTIELDLEVGLGAIEVTR